MFPLFSSITHYVESLPEVDMSTIDPADMRCPHCWSDFGNDSDAYTTEEESETIDAFRELPFPMCVSCNDPVRTQCGHLFGKSCLMESMATNARCPLCRFLLEFQAQFDQHRAAYENWRPRDALESWHELGIGACIGKLVIFPYSIWTSFSDAWRNQLKRCAPADRDLVNNAFDKICKNMIIDVIEDYTDRYGDLDLALRLHISRSLDATFKLQALRQLLLSVSQAVCIECELADSDHNPSAPQLIKPAVARYHHPFNVIYQHASILFSKQQGAMDMLRHLQRELIQCDCSIKACRRISMMCPHASISESTLKKLNVEFENLKYEAEKWALMLNLKLR